MSNDPGWEMPPDPETEPPRPPSPPDEPFPTWIHQLRDEPSSPPQPEPPDDTKIPDDATAPHRPILPPDKQPTKRPSNEPGRPPTRRMPRADLPHGEQPTILSQVPPPYQPPSPAAAPPLPPRPQPSRAEALIRAGVVTLFVLLALGLLLLVGLLIGYQSLAAQLPSPSELQTRQFQFRTSSIYDRNGNLLWEINDPNYGKRVEITLNDVSPHLVAATISTEDRNFYQNVGVDPIAIARAVYYNVQENEIVSGASTITQQLVRNVLLSPEEKVTQSLGRKIKEAVLAIEVTRQYSKQEILATYLNQIYYGNLAYGIEAASQTYFGKSARDLTMPEAAFLAGLPQSPAIYDPYNNPEGAKRRQEVVLGLMLEAGYIDNAAYEAALIDPVLARLKSPSLTLAAPHFVNYVRAELEANYPADLIYQAGLRIETTLDQNLQSLAETEVRRQVDALAANNATNGALVTVQPQTGEILAMVGSKDYNDAAIAGQINMAVSPRQPGSTIKPLAYLTAFEQGWTPATLLMDVPVEYTDAAGNIYRPTNYDQEFHGPVSVRTGLANSYNVPAVKTLDAVGLPAFKNLAARLGITTLNRDDLGLAASLGSGEVPLVQMVGAYQAMANNGVRIPPHAIARVLDAQGREITPAPPVAERVLSEAHAYLITHILADNQARSIEFGPNSLLNLGRPAAAKTGTTNDFRDNLVIGYTPDLVTGVWVGNADYSPMVNTTGLSGAGPIWHNFMSAAHANLPVRDFVRPGDIVTTVVCADSGTLPSEACPQTRPEIFAVNQPPLGSEQDIHQFIDIDRRSEKRANEFCRGDIETRYYQVYPPDGYEWALARGIQQPPQEECPSTSITAEITAPTDGDTVRGTVTIYGTALAANFDHYRLEYGVSAGPQAFADLSGPVNQLVEGGVLGTFDTRRFENGVYTLRLVVLDRSGGSLQARTRIVIDNPATPTALPTATAIPPTATVTPLPSLTPTATPSQAPTPLATHTATPPPTNTPTVEITVTPTIGLTPEAPSDPSATPTPANPVVIEPTNTIPPLIPSVTPTLTATVVSSPTVNQP